MQFEHRYFGHSRAETGPLHSALAFAPDTLRPPTFFSGTIDRRLPFREGMAALHAVVVGDHRPRSRDRTAYLEWRARQDALETASLLAGAGLRRKGLTAELAQTRDRLAALEAETTTLQRPFLRAQQRYFRWLLRHDRTAWVVLDPVITVHPDQLFFECFSQDESTYARFGCGYETFAEVGDHACGTTNVDYSRDLAAALARIRSYRDTRLEIDPTGFTVQTDDDAHREVKIDLPPSWVRGFLQVGAAMGMEGARLRLDPVDLHNILFTLRRRRERHGPRSLRFLFDGPLRVRVEPWDLELPLPRSTVLSRTGMHGRALDEVRVWGRRRLAVLERLLPVTRSVDVVLPGSGLPTFWIADLGGMDFTLGLSGWTSNDWSRQGAFDLLGPQGDVDASTRSAVLQALQSAHAAPAEQLARSLNLSVPTVRAALLQLIQAGRAMPDLARGVVRSRELFREPLDPADPALRFASPREADARALLDAHGVLHVAAEAVPGATQLTGQVQGPRGQWRVSARIDTDEQLRSARCTCAFYAHNKLHKGPCAHILALRMAWSGPSGAAA